MVLLTMGFVYLPSHLWFWEAGLIDKVQQLLWLKLLALLL